MTNHLIPLVAALSLASSVAFGQVASDVTGILRRPIPDKLIVLTFDDAPASHATIVAPILKEMGFGGTFYVCDFDSFRTRKDWYLTYRQMQSMAKDGFEIGNHTLGHGGGLSNFLAMEDALLAHRCPKPTTVCWPVYAANPGIYSQLAAQGYSWGRGGHERPYRPTVDNPFDVPSFTIKDSVTVEAFIQQAQQACQGRIVVYCFHGVPDKEHPGVSLEPATFRAMMQFLKENRYQCLAMRDLGRYIDPAKAALLPQTASRVARESPFETIQTDKPYAPTAFVRPRPTPAKPAVVSPTKNILSLTVPGATSIDMAGTSVGIYVPADTDVKTLAPTFTLSPFAAAVPPFGTSRDFTAPQTYAVTAQDGSTRVYTVTVFKKGEPVVYSWRDSVAGAWSDASKWTRGGDADSSLVPGGNSDYALGFDRVGACSIANDINVDSRVCRLALGEAPGTLTMTGNGLTLAKNRVSGFPPVMTVGKERRRVVFETPLRLADDLHVQTVNSVSPNSLTAFKGVISGTGGLILNSWGEPDSARLNSHDVHYGILQFENTNTYSGGTVANGGKLLVMKPNGLGTGPVTLNQFATLGAHARIDNPVVINQGRLSESICGGPITLNSVADFHGNCDIRGDMDGPGGFTMLGRMGTYLSIVPGGTVTLHGNCSYLGPTTVFPGTLVVKKAAGLYAADAAKWTPKNISIRQTATLRIHAGGEDEFTGEQVGLLLGNLTTDVDDNGLMGGAWFCIDTTNATEPVVLAANFTDSSGPGGGPITFKKSGPGTLKLAGGNSYSGRTYLEGGVLSVASLNSVEGRSASSSLGAPTTLEDGMIDLSGDCTLVYTGNGETTDRILDFNGKRQTVTLDQSGGGLLKFTSPLDMSGFGFSKTLVLQGSSTGTGELSGDLVDPHDRDKKATTSLTKAGAGTWTLSGNNTYSGPTNVIGGVLSIAGERSLSQDTAVSVSAGAVLELNFKGQAIVRRLLVNGKTQRPGEYDASNVVDAIRGTGSLRVTAE